jgi:hypothetical protein
MNKMSKSELKEDFLRRIEKAKNGECDFQITKLSYPTPKDAVKQISPSLLAASKTYR